MQQQDMTDAFKPIVEALGCQLWGLELIRQGKHSVLRLYIDKDGGVGADECAKISHQVSGILEVEDPIKSAYRLEVSSPGLDRVLFTLEQYQSYIGKEVELRLRTPHDGKRRRFKGVLTQIEGEKITLEVEGKAEIFDFNNIERGQLVVDFESLL